MFYDEVEITSSIYRDGGIGADKCKQGDMKYRWGSMFLLKSAPTDIASSSAPCYWTATLLQKDISRKPKSLCSSRLLSWSDGECVLHVWTHVCWQVIIVLLFNSKILVSSQKFQLTRYGTLITNWYCSWASNIYSQKSVAFWYTKLHQQIASAIKVLWDKLMVG